VLKGLRVDDACIGCYFNLSRTLRRRWPPNNAISRFLACAQESTRSACAGGGGRSRLSTMPP